MAKTKTANIVDSHGQPGRLKLRRIREFEAAGAGRWVEATFVFTRRCDPVPTHRQRASQRVVKSPTIGRITSRRVDQFSGSDSGFGLLRYPLPCQSGEKFPGLARMGAGV